MLSGETNLVLGRTPTGALELAGQIGFVDHVSFALVRLGSNALARGDTRQAEELCRRALAMAEAASTSRLAAHARVQFARALEAAGDADTAETLYGSVVEWSQRRGRARCVSCSSSCSLAGPGAAALWGLAGGSPGGRRRGQHLQGRAAAMAADGRRGSTSPATAAAWQPRSLAWLASDAVPSVREVMAGD
ncbi:MAG TPA: tetratricopeptide repeat protein, partial [Actinomycetes bacterium]|nr:tetratricopeptide repeat protein [Actinomycetes bacterium]